MNKYSAYVVPLSLLLVGCSKISGPSIECSSDESQATVLSILKDELTKSVAENLSAAGFSSVDKAKIRAAVAEVTTRISDIRTSKRDPNSSKKFCEANFDSRFGGTIVADAEETRRLAELGSITELASSKNVAQQADLYKQAIAYSVQPTDDGEQVYAMVDDAKSIASFQGEVIASQLLRPAIEQRNAQKQQQAQAIAEQEAAEQVETASALALQKQASLEQAKAENALSTQTINQSWKNLDISTRDQIIDIQRAWIKKKAADCALEAAGASTDTNDQEIVRLKCDSRANEERTAFLQRQVG